MTRRISVWLAIALPALAACDLGGRPSCSRDDRNCGEGWVCETEESCPILCTSHICYALGHLDMGQECLRGSECVPDHHCAPPPDDPGGDGRCWPDECAIDDDCVAGERCRRQECVATLGLSCETNRLGELGCADHETCEEGECVAAPEVGGNECGRDEDCAASQTCGYYVGARRCARECAAAADCPHTGRPFCHEGFCSVCTEADCPGACDVHLGCVGCVSADDCPMGSYCQEETSQCLTACRAHTECDSGTCWTSGTADHCVADLGTRCAEETIRDAVACHDGACLARDAAGAALPPYCTRRCRADFDDFPPCPSGYVCQTVELGEPYDLCVRR